MWFTFQRLGAEETTGLSPRGGVERKRPSQDPVRHGLKHSRDSSDTIRNELKGIFKQTSFEDCIFLADLFSDPECGHDWF